MSAHSGPRLDVYAHLGTVLHNWVKKYPQRVFLEPQCLRYEIGEPVAQFLALGEVPQEILFKPGDILLVMPLKMKSVRARQDHPQLGGAHLSGSPQFKILGGPRRPWILIGGSKVVLLPLVCFPLGVLCAYPRVSQEMGIIPHQQIIFLLLRDRKQLGSIVDDQINVILRNGGIGQIQKPDVYESVSELIQKLWTSCGIIGKGEVQHGNGGEILTGGHALQSPKSHPCF